MHTTTMRTVTLLVLAAAGLVFSEAHAANIWTGSESSDWFEGLNWSEGHYPAAGEDVVVDSGANILLTNATADLGSFTLNGGTLTFSNWTTRLIATNVTLSGGTVTHTLTDTNAMPSTTNRVVIQCSNLTVEVGGTIDVSAVGFRGGDSIGRGHGPGGGISFNAFGTSYGGGGGYGGNGGKGYDKAYGGVKHGSAAAVVLPGSGGGGEEGRGGHGGGLCVIEASGHVQLDGSILANGRNFILNWGGGGSGGGISITCRTLDGSGTLRADGGNGSNNGGGGGGGRIALLFNPEYQATISPQPRYTLSVAGGTAGATTEAGGIGSLYLADAALVQQSVLSLITANVYLPTNSIAFASSLIVSNATIGFARGISVTVDGNFDLVKGGSLRLHGGITSTNTSPGATLEVSGDITVATNCTLYAESHPTNGGSVKLVMRNLTVDAGGTINADGLGYRGGIGHEGGYGPGGGSSDDPFNDRPYGGGGGYGGNGANGYAAAHGGSIYGISNAPAWPGSGGGGSGGGNGGGFVCIESSGIVSVSGRIIANGANSMRQFGGGGSGGGIRIRCQTFTGDGELRADGGNGNNNGGGGGGGRIAVLTRLTDNAVSQLLNDEWPPRIIIRNQEDYDIDFTVGAGTSSQGYTGDDGTIVILNQHPPAGTMISIH